MSLIDELHKLMKEKKYTYAYTASGRGIASTAFDLNILYLPVNILINSKQFIDLVFITV